MLAEADDVGIDIGVRMIQRISHAGLCLVDHTVEGAVRKQARNAVAVGHIHLDEEKILRCAEAPPASPCFKAGS